MRRDGRIKKKEQEEIYPERERRTRGCARGSVDILARQLLLWVVGDGAPMIFYLRNNRVIARFKRIDNAVRDRDRSGKSCSAIENELREKRELQRRRRMRNSSSRRRRREGRSGEEGEHSWRGRKGGRGEGEGKMRGGKRWTLRRAAIRVALYISELPARRSLDGEQ